MANTYFQIGSTVTVGSGGASSIDFTSIPDTWTDLLIKLSVRHNYSPDSTMAIKFNGSTTGYSWKRLLGVGSGSASSYGDTNLTFAYADHTGYTANTFANIETYIPNYAGSNYKSYSTDSVSENNGTEAVAAILANLWSDTSAITSISIYSLGGGTLQQHTTASLYGIKKN